MFGFPASRALAVTIAALVVTAAALVVAHSDAVPVVSAQRQPTATINAIQIPPPVPGIDYPSIGSADVPVTAPVVAATPSAPADPALATGEIAAPESGGSLTATLGGSDVAVSSVGGSYERDGAKRRGNRNGR